MLMKFDFLKVPFRYILHKDFSLLFHKKDFRELHFELYYSFDAITFLSLQLLLSHYIPYGLPAKLTA
jgi:hypothetical protein